MASEPLLIPSYTGIRVQNGGWFVSRGRGIHPRRVIDTYELIFVSGGILAMQEGATRFNLQAGASLLLWPGREHFGASPYAPDTSFYWLHFEREDVASLEGALRVPQMVSPVARPEVLSALFRRFLDDQESGLLTPGIAAHLVALMLHEVALPPAAPAASGPAAVLAQHAHQYIVVHIGEALTTSRIARALDCHPDYLGRCYRAAYGITLTEEIQRQRLKRARALLVDGNATVEAIARECGFPGVTFFRRIFRRYEGVSLTAFRRQYARVHINTV